MRQRRSRMPAKLRQVASSVRKPFRLNMKCGARLRPACPVTRQTASSLPQLTTLKNRVFFCEKDRTIWEIAKTRFVFGEDFVGLLAFGRT